MNEPMGRFGSCRPLRARRTALATASMASSWPTTRCSQPLLHLHQLLALAFEHARDRDAGPRGDDLGDVLLGDFLGEQALRLLGLSRRPSRRRASFFCSSGMRPYWICAASVQVACAAAPARARSLACSSWLLTMLTALMAAFSFCHWALSCVGLLLEVGQLLLQLLQPLLAGLVLLLLQRASARSPVAGFGARSGPSRSAWSPSPSAAARPPRPSGQSPCPAGSGRRCSGATAWPPPPAPRPGCARRGGPRSAP